MALERALVARIGLGDGESVADGRFAEAWELPPPGARRTRRSMEAPEERFAALLGGHASPLAAEELVLRARADVDAGRMREAALQARVALEALLAELGAGGVRGSRAGAAAGGGGGEPGAARRPHPGGRIRARGMRRAHGGGAAAGCGSAAERSHRLAEIFTSRLRAVR